MRPCLDGVPCRCYCERMDTDRKPTEQELLAADELRQLDEDRYQEWWS